jgi:putative ABC transport system ATP-binding protein
MISFKNISKSFSTPSWDQIKILENMSLQVDQWSFVALMWPSGTWKSTLLNLIAGLERPNAGELLVDTTDTSALSDDEYTTFRGKNISFVFQQFHLLPQLTVAENIDLVVELNKLERRFTTSQILEKVGLKWRESNYPSTLSGWEQQRVAVARAFVAKTPILLADEPTGNLDQGTARQIMELMKDLHTEVNNTIIMITHDRDIADYADTLYLLQDYTVVKQ